MDCRSLKKGISIIGTGDFGRSIGKRLVITGYDVTFGSRRPEVRNLRADDKVFVNTVVTSVGEALRKNSIIVFAVRAIHFEEVISKFRPDLSGKLIIDVSNKSRRDRYLTSNAEILQNLVPEATVVKAFNVISAYAMEADFDGSSRLVPVASNSCKARSKVKDIARSMGFQPFDAGMLTSARDIEMYVHWLFPKWQFPILITVLILIVWWLHVTYVYYVQSETYSWEQLFVKVFNKPLAMTAVTVLSLTYMPGCLAGFLQLRNGTKHRRFPWWLDSWLKSRKQLGLICFFIVCLHVCISVLLMSPTYFHSWFHGTEHDIHAHHVPKPDVEPWMTWKGEIASLLGILTYALMCVLAVTSIPSVAETLNWVEWHFIQSKLGFLALILAVCHAWVMGIPHWLDHTSPTELLLSITFMSTLLPSCVLLMRFTLCLPLIRPRLKKIRMGWESESVRTSAFARVSNGEAGHARRGNGQVFQKVEARERMCPCSSDQAASDCCNYSNGEFCCCGDQGLEVKVKASSCCQPTQPPTPVKNGHQLPVTLPRSVGATPLHPRPVESFEQTTRVKVHQSARKGETGRPETVSLV